MSYRNVVLAGASLFSLVQPALAQSTGDLAAADPAASDTDIVVTAERTERSLRDTAASVVVATGADIDRLGGAYSTDDILSRIPNLVSVRPSSTAPTVRGIDGTGPAVGGTAFFGGTRPRLNYQVDNRTLTFNEALYSDGLLWDVQQVEVYRGAQSTLQGRNAIGGVVAVKTADPDFTWSGRARGVIGESDIGQISGAVGGPIVPDVLAFRIAADWRTEESWVDFPAYTARRAGLSAGLKEIDNPSLSRALTLRGKLLFTPSPDVRALVTLSHLDAFSPQSAEVVRPFQDHVASFPQQPRFRTRANVGIADIDARVGGGLSLALLATAADFRIVRFAAVDSGNALINGREYSVEPRIRFGETDSAVSGFVAGLLYRADQDEEIDLFNGVFEDHTDTDAVFGELTVKPAPALNLTFGARYEEEKRDRQGGAGPFVIDFHRTFRAFLPRGTVSWNASDAVTIGATVGRGYNAGGAGFSFDPPFPSYAYDKETVTNYEAFFRSTLADGKLDLRGNVFFNDYDGLQLSVDINPDPAVFAFEIGNLERATTYGLELEAKYRALKGLTLFGSVGLLKTKINRAIDPAIQGNELERSPAFSFSAGFNARPIDPLELSFDLRYTDTYYSDAFNAARGKVDPYMLANAQIAWRAGLARIFVAASNLFDTTDAIRLAPGATVAADVATITRPRRVTAGFELSF